VSFPPFSPGTDRLICQFDCRFFGELPSPISAFAIDANMSNLSSPVDGPKLPYRSNTLRTVSTGTERRASMSEDEAIPGSDSNEVCYPVSLSGPRISLICFVRV
jgi:hypothetical protein